MNPDAMGADSFGEVKLIINSKIECVQNIIIPIPIIKNTKEGIRNLLLPRSFSNLSLSSVVSIPHSPYCSVSRAQYSIQ